MLGLLAGLTGLLGPVSNIVASLNQYKIAQVNATAEVDKQAIQKQIDALHDKATVLTAEIGNRFAAMVTATVQAMIAIPVAAFVWKVLLWDKVVGSWPDFSTDLRNTDQLWYVILAIIGFYFVTILRK